MLIKRSLFYYWRTNLAVIAGVAIAVAVLAGALVVGESVRASLRDLVLQRLGRTDDVVFSTGFFRESLVDELKAHRAFGDSFEAACPLIVLEGFVSDQITGRRASGVQIYGIDDRFWRFHGREAISLPGADALLSEGLAQELGTGAGGSILLRVETRPAIPVESLHGRKEDLGRTVRLSVRKILPASDLGEFSLRPQQGAVRAVFVPLGRLQSALEREGRVNTILISRRDSAKNDAQDASRQLIERLVRETARLEDLGLTLRALTNHRSLALESDSAVISDALATAARAAAARQGQTAMPVLSYLANAIRLDERGIPYSVVTALDLKEISGPSRSPISDPRSRSRIALPPIVLNAWAARDLGARVGSTVSLDYYVWEEEGRLETRSAAFQVAGIVPIAGPAADRDLTPNYPGITNSDRLSDWDPPFPIDLSRGSCGGRGVLAPVPDDAQSIRSSRNRTTALGDPLRVADVLARSGRR